MGHYTYGLPSCAGCIHLEFMHDTWPYVCLYYSRCKGVGKADYRQEDKMAVEAYKLRCLSIRRRNPLPPKALMHLVPVEASLEVDTSAPSPVTQGVEILRESPAQSSR